MADIVENMPVFWNKVPEMLRWQIKEVLKVNAELPLLISMINNRRNDDWQVLVEFIIRQKTHPLLNLIIQGLKSGESFEVCFYVQRESTAPPREFYPSSRVWPPRLNRIL